MAETEDITEEATPCDADELSLTIEVVSYPHEHHMQLVVALGDVFDADIYILLHPGSGEMINAALKQHKLALATCKHRPPTRGP